jgi:DNA-directed RNA polymerase subunit M
MFCPDCGSILTGDDGTMTCDCGYSSDDAETSVQEKVEEKEELQVVEEDAEDETLPITEEECPECGNDKARYWLQQMRSGDEPETQFFKCTECSHTWREG